jgi:hypothetical protein
MTDPWTRCQILLLLALLAPQCAPAAVTDSVNSVRRHGCGARPGGARSLRENARLDQVARQLSLGAEPSPSPRRPRTTAPRSAAACSI